MLTLGHNEIHLWLTDDRAICTPTLLGAYRSLLDTNERTQQQRFHFEKDRHRYLVTRALTRSVLSRYAPVTPENWRFRKLEHGRPQIINPEAIGLTFNITHTTGLIVLAVMSGGELGIDAENIVERTAPLDVAPRYFSSNETSALRALPPEAQNERFFHYWTLKESYIKARSQGLSLPLDRFSFQWPDAQSIAIEFDPRLADAPENWDFQLLRPTHEHLLAVCSSRQKSAPPPQLYFRQITPLAEDRTLTIAPLRASCPP
jgi:4'-phosphopantetheinyl transferase